MNGVKSKINKKGNLNQSHYLALYYINVEKKPGFLNRRLPWLPIALTTVSLVVLVIPLEGWPSYNTINYNHKLIAAFLIGSYVPIL